MLSLTSLKEVTLYRILALLMAQMMFFSSFGFSMDMHYCQNELKGINLLGKAKTCHSKKSACKNHSNSISQEENNNCCHNSNINVEPLDTDATPTATPTLSDINIHFIVVFAANYLCILPSQTSQTNFLAYKPPLPDRDIQILFQRFII